jgi:phosphomannomutase
MITASHNPPEFNGIKLFAQDALGYSPEQESEVERVYSQGAFRAGQAGHPEAGAGDEGEVLLVHQGQVRGAAV